MTDPVLDPVASNGVDGRVRTWRFWPRDRAQLLEAFAMLPLVAAGVLMAGAYLVGHRASALYGAAYFLVLPSLAAGIILWGQRPVVVTPTELCLPRLLGVTRIPLREIAAVALLFLRVPRYGWFVCVVRRNGRVDLLRWPRLVPGPIERPLRADRRRLPLRVIGYRQVRPVLDWDAIATSRPARLATVIDAAARAAGGSRGPWSATDVPRLLAGGSSPRLPVVACWTPAGVVDWTGPEPPRVPVRPSWAVTMLAASFAVLVIVGAAAALVSFPGFVAWLMPAR